jgi:uncharacterized protein (DUF433 family)
MRTDPTSTRQSIGTPIVRGTRILPDAIVNSFDAGGTLDDIHEDYPGISIPQIQRLILFAHARQP